MLDSASSLATMFAFLLGFATINAEGIPDGIMPQRRQVVGTGVTTSSTPTTSATQSNPTTSNSPTTSNTKNNSPSTSTPIPITSTSADGTQTTTHVTSDSITSDKTSDKTSDNTSDKTTDSAVQTTKGTDNSVVKVGSTTIDPKTLAHKTTVREPLVTKATKHQTLTSTWTSNGHVYSSVYTTENVFASTTGYATATIAPSLANAGGDGSNLSTNTKKIIGGVVGGIGGAILIGGLAFVLWRLYGKKKNQDVQQDDMYSSDSLSAQKRYSGNTLDTAPYSNPNGAVNTASNF